MCEKTQAILLENPIDKRSLKRLHSIIKVLAFVASSDEANVEYLLNMGLIDYLMEVLQWNNPV